jgi:ATP-dependent helicase/nuclease subunit B
MPTLTFLQKLSQTIFEKFSHDFSNLTIVLPNKRAKVFLLEALRENSKQTFFAPTICSVEEFIQNVSGIRSIDAVEVLFEFYEVYRNITPKEEIQAFEQFSNWAKTLLQDFNEIDRYLLEPNHVFSYLKDIEAIKRWDLEPQDKTELVDNYLKFWHNMPIYYQAFYQALLKKGIGYQGLLYREAVENLTHFINAIGSNHYVFAGFNALNQAEEKIIQQLLSQEVASIYWDADEAFLNDPFHDAGLFARKIKKSWTHYKNHPYEWIFNQFKEEKNIHIIGTPKMIGQVKITGSIINDITNHTPLDKVAVVLGEETILIPLLYSLPKSVTELNITMGYSSKNNPAQLLVNKLFKMHQNAMGRSQNSYVYYYKDVLDILNNVLIEPFIQTKKLISIINSNNYSFITKEKLFELQKEPNVLFQLLFEKWDNQPSWILERLSEILIQIKNQLSNEIESEKITKAFVYSVFKVITKLTNYCSEHIAVQDIAVLYSIYKQIIDLAEVSFEGEPLQGLQIMGVLESRVLDFDTVIITSMNEGTFPAGKSQNSFIPFDVKRELGLPTFKEKDAIYTYHFYHLLQRAKTIYLLYNTESEGIDAGEKSRFITQLEFERYVNHNITHDIYNAVLPEKANEPIVIEKSERVMERLKELFSTSLSPSSITTYIRNPIQFYYQKVLRISEVDEVEENIAVNTLGTIIHKSLEELYKPYLNVYLSVSIVDQMIAIADIEVLKQFKEIYKEGEIYKGKNLIAYEVAKRNIYNYLKLEKKLLEENEVVKVLFLEKNFEQLLEDVRLPFPVNIKGNVDRIELRNNKLRIIDYKTGKVEQNSLSIQTFDGITLAIKNDKIIQLLCYAFMIQSEFPNTEIEAGIISFKNLKVGFMPFQIKEGRDVITNLIDTSVLEAFKTELIGLLNEILDREFPFEEKTV